MPVSRKASSEFLLFSEVEIKDLRISASNVTVWSRFAHLSITLKEGISAVLRDSSRMLVVGLVRTWVDFCNIGEPSRRVTLGDELCTTLTKGKE